MSCQHSSQVGPSTLAPTTYIKREKAGGRTGGRPSSGEVPSGSSPTAGVSSDPFMSCTCSGLPKICDANAGGGRGGVVVGRGTQGAPELRVAVGRGAWLARQLCAHLGADDRLMRGGREPVQEVARRVDGRGRRRRQDGAARRRREASGAVGKAAERRRRGRVGAVERDRGLRPRGRGEGGGDRRGAGALQPRGARARGSREGTGLSQVRVGLQPGLSSARARARLGTGYEMGRAP